MCIRHYPSTLPVDQKPGSTPGPLLFALEGNRHCGFNLHGVEDRTAENVLGCVGICPDGYKTEGNQKAQGYEEMSTCCRFHPSGCSSLLVYPDVCYLFSYPYNGIVEPPVIDPLVSWYRVLNLPLQVADVCTGFAFRPASSPVAPIIARGCATNSPPAPMRLAFAPEVELPNLQLILFVRIIGFFMRNLTASRFT